MTEKLIEELDNACRVTMTVGEFWQRAIALILSAVHDGRLDEELGVEGRHDLGWPDCYHEVAHGWIDNLPDASLELIALRKEEQK